MYAKFFRGTYRVTCLKNYCEKAKEFAEEFDLYIRELNFLVEGEEKSSLVHHAQTHCKEFYIVLGNMPLAPDVVSLDTLFRIKTAISKVKNEAESKLYLIP